jgi:hypothetical protein
LMPSMMRFQVPPRADSLNHTPVPHVNNLLLKLIDSKVASPLSLYIFSMQRLPVPLTFKTGSYMIKMPVRPL